MLGQTDESKLERFVDTMLTIIQTHLITCKTWAVQVQEGQYNYDDTNNYYHNENYRGQSRGCRPHKAKIQVNFSEVKIPVVEVSAIKIHTKANIRTIAIQVIITKVIVV